MDDELLRLWPRAEQILDDVLDAPEGDREARALAACGGDASLRHAVSSLLRADRDCAGFLDGPASDPSGAEDPPAGSPALPARVGPFRVVRELGRGGMGTVLLAERDDGQFAQRVAVKLLHDGAFSPAAREGLLRERRILGRLEHPHIARLFDGGVTEEGVPYFVMEYVDGRALDDHCDALEMGIEGRLGLFTQVCVALEYAHGRLVVHRDLKPGNVLVDARGDVKLLDFGIAKVLEESGDATLTNARVFTPVYAAPEQVRGEPVTTATDVYQLGLLLYELLTGHRAQGRTGQSVLLLHRRVVEVDPERPSRVALTAALRPGGVTWTPEEIARRRRTSAAALSRRLEGDLDAIVSKALRKEPDHRYAAVDALRRDVEAFLESRPVAARRGSASYRLAKYVRRNGLRLAMAGGLAASLGGGLVAARAQARVAARERDRAQVAEAKAGAINDFLVNELLSAPTPEKAMGRPLSVADVLGNASRTVGHAFGGQPVLEAEVRQTLASTYAALGRLPEARTNAQAAYDLLARQRGGEGAEALRVRRVLAELSLEEGRYAEARAELEQVHQAQAALLGPHHTDTLGTAAAVGRAAQALGNWSEAESLLRQALAAAEEHHPGRWRLALELQRSLVATLIAQEKGRAAEALCRQMLERQRPHLGPEHPDVAKTLAQLATSLYSQLRYREAVAVYEEVVALDERLFGADHPATAEALTALAAAYVNGFQRHADAGRVQTRAYEIYRKALGPEHPRALKARENVGVLERRAGRDRVAEDIYREVLAARRRVLGESHPETIRSRLFLNQLLLDTHRTAEARQMGRQAFEAYEAALAGPHPDPTLMSQYAKNLTELEPEDLRDPPRALQVAEWAVGLTGRQQYQPLVELGNAYGLVGQPDRAIATLEEALALPEAARSWTSEGLLVDLLRQHRPPEELERFLLARIQRLLELRGSEDRMVAKTMRSLALHYQGQGRAADAERTFRDVLDQLRKGLEDGNWEVGRAKSELGGCLLARRAYAEAEPLLLQGHAALSERPGRSTKEARDRLVQLYGAWGRPADAARWRTSVP